MLVSDTDTDTDSNSASPFKISSCCATHCTLHNTIAPTLFWLADTLLNYIFTSVWTKIYDYVIW